MSAKWCCPLSHLYLVCYSLLHVIQSAPTKPFDSYLPPRRSWYRNSSSEPATKGAQTDTVSPRLQLRFNCSDCSRPFASCSKCHRLLPTWPASPAWHGRHCLFIRSYEPGVKQLEKLTIITTNYHHLGIDFTSSFDGRESRLTRCI